MPSAANAGPLPTNQSAYSQSDFTVFLTGLSNFQVQNLPTVYFSILPVPLLYELSPPFCVIAPGLPGLCLAAFPDNNFRNHNLLGPAPPGNRLGCFQLTSEFSEWNRPTTDSFLSGIRSAPPVRRAAVSLNKPTLMICFPWLHLD
jgi:hypothetical protein